MQYFIQKTAQAALKRHCVLNGDILNLLVIDEQFEFQASKKQQPQSSNPCANV